MTIGERMIGRENLQLCCYFMSSSAPGSTYTSSVARTIVVKLILRAGPPGLSRYSLFAQKYMQRCPAMSTVVNKIPCASTLLVCDDHSAIDRVVITYLSCSTSVFKRASLQVKLELVTEESPSVLTPEHDYLARKISGGSF